MTDTPDTPRRPSTSTLAPHPERRLSPPDAPERMGTIPVYLTFATEEAARHYAEVSGFAPDIVAGTSLRLPKGIESALVDLYRREGPTPA